MVIYQGPVPRAGLETGAQALRTGLILVRRTGQLRAEEQGQGQKALFQRDSGFTFYCVLNPLPRDRSQ